MDLAFRITIWPPLVGPPSLAAWVVVDTVEVKIIRAIGAGLMGSLLGGFLRGAVGFYATAWWQDRSICTPDPDACFESLMAVAGGFWGAVVGVVVGFVIGFVRRSRLDR